MGQCGMASGRKRKFKGTDPKGSRAPYLPAEDPKKVALGQPHRKGSDLNRLGSPLGRLLNMPGGGGTGLSHRALYDVGMRFAEAYSSAQAVMASRRPLANSQAIGRLDLSREEAEEYLDKWDEAERVLRRAGAPAYKAVHYTVLDHQEEDWQPPFWVQNACIHGLVALAQHFGIEVVGEDRRG